MTKVKMAVLIAAMAAISLFAADVSADWISVAEPRAGARSAGVVARAFVNGGDVKSARWTVSGLGVFTCYANGAEVGAQDVLKPGFTYKEKRRNSFEYDVTALLRRGAGETNVLAAVLTSGWWSDGILGKTGGKENAFRGELRLEYANGSVEVVATDESWVGARRGAVHWAGIWEGEFYDARDEFDLGSAASFAGWGKVRKNDEFGGLLEPIVGAKVGLRAPLAPVSAYVWREVVGADMSSKRSHERRHGKVVAKPCAFPVELEAGDTLVVDFGQNCAAVPRFKVSGAAGTRFPYRMAEMLNDGEGAVARGCDGPEGSLYLANLRGAAKDQCYVLAGKAGGETYSPRHTFYGYRYFSVKVDAKVVVESVESVPVSSIVPALERGTLEVGEKDVDRLVRNVWWGMLSNYLSVPTDCPQRNERLGWTADTQVFAKTSGYFADTRAFFRKWMRDMRDSVAPNGYFPDVAPRGAFGGCGQAAWGDAGIVVPYRVWRQFADAEIVRENWAAMMRYMEAIDKSDYVMKKGGWVLADWLSFERLSSNQRLRWSDGSFTMEHLDYQNFLNACYMVWDCEMMSEMASVVAKDKAEEMRLVSYFGALERRTRERIAKTWLKEDGSLCDLLRDMQTPRLMAVKIGIGDVARHARELVEMIHANGDRLATGFVGTPELCEVLTEIGEDELAWTILLQHEFPSWLYSVDQGATTIWERWNGYTRERGFGDVGMNSFNHYAYGCIVGWLFERAAGIAPGRAAGYDEFVLAPHPDRRAGSLRATYRTDKGTIVSAWRYEGDKCIWEYEIPEGASAIVTVPGRSPVVCKSGRYTETFMHTGGKR